MISLSAHAQSENNINCKDVNVFDKDNRRDTRIVGEDIHKNVSKRTGIIKRMKHFLPNQTIVMLSNALVIPHFDYGSTVWSNFSAENHRKLQVLHNILARIILSADIRTPTNELMDALQ